MFGKYPSANLHRTGPPSKYSPGEDIGGSLMQRRYQEPHQLIGLSDLIVKKHLITEIKK